MGRACSTNGAKRNAYRILGGTPDNIKMDLRKIGLIWLRIGTSGGLL
jgi:hypothetical protein